MLHSKELIKIKNPTPFGYVYITSNKVNGRKYVGQHKGLFTPNYLGSGVAIKGAIKKYGKGNFVVSLVEYCFSQTQLSEREIYWIEFASTKQEWGHYNIADGGYGSSGWKHTKEAKESMSKKRSGKNNYNAIKIINLTTGEVFDSLSEARDKYKLKTSNGIYKVCKGINVSASGCKWAYYEDYLTGNIPIREEKERQTTQVINLDTNEVFDSIKEACNKYNLSHANIIKACKEEINGTGGYNWAYYEDYLKGNYSIKNVMQKQPIINLDTLEVFETSVDAGKKYNISRSNITYCCQGKRKKAGGYRWQYYKDYLSEGAPK